MNGMIYFSFLNLYLINYLVNNDDDSRDREIVDEFGTNSDFVRQICV